MISCHLGVYFPFLPYNLTPSFMFLSRPPPSQDKEAQLNLVQTKFSALEEHLDRQRENHERLLAEIDQVNSRLAEERARSASLMEQLRTESRDKDAVEGLNFQIGRLSQENR